MKKYIIEYDLYEDLLLSLGTKIPHTNLENIKHVIVNLSDKDFNRLTLAGIKIVENQKIELLAVPNTAVQPKIATSVPSPIQNYYNLASSYAAGFTGTGVNIAILDTSCNASPYVTSCPSVIRQDYTGLGFESGEVHGGNGVNIIGQTIRIGDLAVVNTGIAYGAQIYSMRIYEAGFAGILTAIDWCIANNIHIMNFSLSMGTGLDSALQTAMNAGIIVVCASGNDILNNMTHPANVAGVIAVNAVGSENTLPVGFALNGSYLMPDGSKKVTVTNYESGGHQYWVGGTSQAAFMVTGLLAIYKQKYPTLNTQKAMNLLRRKALKMDGYTYTESSSTLNTTINYQTGAGFVAPIY